MIKKYSFFSDNKKVLFLLLLIVNFTISAQTVRYVKQGGTGNGWSWETATGNLQAAIDDAQSGWHVYVAAGTYQPASGQSFSMKNGVKIYGGFAATGTPGFADRNPALNFTILLGNGNRVISNSGLDTSSCLDGFTITGGTLSGGENGGGIQNVNSSAKFVNCIIKNNSVANWGGGIYNRYGYSEFINCLIYGNQASGGAGVFEHEAQSTYTNCTISGNTSTQNGGGIHTHESGTLTIVNTILWNNSAAAEGDEIFTTGSSTAVALYSIVENYGDDIYGNFVGPTATYTDPMFTDAANNNYIPLYGSPAINSGNNSYINGYPTDLAGNARVYSGTVDRGAFEMQEFIRYVRQGGTGNGLSWNNASGNLQAAIDASAAQDKVYVATGTYTPASGQSFVMKEGVKIYGGFPAGGNPAYSDRNFAANVTVLQGNGKSVVKNNNNGLTTAAVLDGFTLTGGNSPDYGGGMSNVNVSPSVINCIFRNNLAQYGGGISNDGDNTAPLVKNCLFYSNSAVWSGGGTYDFNASTTYLNVTISRNDATYSGGGMATLANANINVSNSIIWGNTSSGQLNQATFYASAETVRNTIIDNSYVPGLANVSGNFTAINVSSNDPMFVDPGNFNFRLQGTSPARQAGDTAQFSFASISPDLDNNPRLVGGTIDMGAYERGLPEYGNTFYVKQGATGEGTSWDNASPSLQSMIDAATTGKQVWVAAGTYTPASGQSFSMKQGVTVYGGFPATGSPGMADRNYKVNVTILNGNGNRVINNNNNGLTNLAILDGFTVRNGNVTGNGGGMNNVNAYPLVANCIFTANTASVWGGGTYNEGAGSPKFVNCLFYTCTASGGGAAFENAGVSTTYANCTIARNSASQNGGGIHTRQYGTAYLNSTIVWANTCSGSGRQLYSTMEYAASDGRVFGNRADVASATNDIAGYYDGYLSISLNPLFTLPGTNNFTLTAASPAIDSGANNHAAGYTRDIAGNSRLSGYTADMGAYEFQSTAPVVRYVRQGGTGNGRSWDQASGNLYSMVNESLAGQAIWVAEGTYGVSGGLSIDRDINIYGGFPATGNPGMADRNWGVYKTIIDGAGSRVISYSNTQNAVLDGVTVTGGGSAFGGGVAATNASPRITNCIFKNNTTVASGGAIFSLNGSPVITNTLFTGNTSGSGAAVYSQGSGNPQFINITAAGNHATDMGGAIFVDNGVNATLKNCIIWQNTAVNGGYQVYSTNTNITVQNSVLLMDVDNSGYYVQAANSIETDPVFLGEDDYSLAPCSPAINMGDTTLIADAETTKDIAGNSRAVGTIDIGAYEYQSASGIAAPVATTPQELESDATVASLVATGSNLKWYSAQEGGTPLDPATEVVAGTYYVSQTIGSCESTRTVVEVTIEIVDMPIRHVKTVASGDGSGSSWDNASADLQLMISSAEPGDQVWVAAGTYQPASGASFSMTEGVKIYGGFPTEGSPGMEDRNPFVYATTLAGNGSRVLDNYAISEASVLDGFIISGGGNVTNGAGMQNTYSSPLIANCIFRENIAGEWGGGMYNYESSPTVANTLFYGNRANGGGASFDHHNSVAKFINVTFTGNVGGNGGAVHTYENATTHMDNCIIWNNDALNGGDQLFALDSGIVARNCLINLDGNNIVGTFNNTNTISGDPLFADAATGNYALLGCSIALNAGDSSLLAGAETAKDLKGDPRLYGSNIDLGAFESQVDVVTVPSVPSPQTVMPGSAISALEATGTDLKWYDSATGGSPLDTSLEAVSGTYYVSQTVDGCESARTMVEVSIYSAPSNIRYVKEGGSGSGDGTSWANASADIQSMINDLETGEIWVASGSYQRGWGSSVNMKTNIKIYGGFPSTGNPGMADRDFVLNETFLVGNAASVVRAVGISDAVLDGFTITSGSTNGYGGGIQVYYASVTLENLNITNNMAQVGGGIVLEGSNSILRHITIWENNAGSYGGGLGILNSAGTDYMENIIVRNNQSSYAGGGIAAIEGAQVILKNVLVSNNSASTAGGLFIRSVTGADFINITAAGNTADYANGVYVTQNEAISVKNSIISDITGEMDIITFSNSLVSGSGGSNSWNSSYGIDNGGNIDGAPMFTGASWGDYSLQMQSPAIDAGNIDWFTYASTSTDIAGNPRLLGSSIDIGAYEMNTDCSITTVWDGSAWSNGIPISFQYEAVIEDSYDSSENGEITACSLIATYGTVVIAEGDSFTIKGLVFVDDYNTTFIVQPNASLVQIDDVDNVGTITVIKESAPMYRLDYALWGSPVANQKLKDFSPQTLDNRFYTYNPLSDAYSVVQNPAATDFAEAKGYLIRVENTHTAFVSNDIAPTRWTGTFAGVPNNGNADITVIPGSGPTAEDADGTKGFNAISNPYPSAINIKAFFDANENNLANNTPIFFWRKKNEAGTSSYCSLTLAGYNANTGNPFGDSSDGMFSNPNDSESWVINSGQGFIVKATSNTVVFRNDMRVAENNGQMFRSAQETSDKSRLWLNISNADGLFGQTMVAYTPTTTLGLDYGWDGQALTDGNVAIYSIAGESKLGIQARPAFDAADEVPVEYKVTTAGEYTISLDHFDGVFAEGQQIYLRDNVLGVTHNLHTPYIFVTEAGPIAARFDVVYAETLSTDDPAFGNNHIIVYQQGKAITINSGNADMKEVAVHDIRGRLLYSSKNINTTEISITALQAQEQMLIVQVTTVDEAKVSKKIVF